MCQGSGVYAGAAVVSPELGLLFWQSRMFLTCSWLSSSTVIVLELLYPPLGNWVLSLPLVCYSWGFLLGSEEAEHSPVSGLFLRDRWFSGCRLHSSGQTVKREEKNGANRIRDRETCSHQSCTCTTGGVLQLWSSDWVHLSF